jgi:predicted AAA+ superfamily ATPase
MFVPRELTRSILEALKSRPLVYLNGPRQVGKSTLCQSLTENGLAINLVSFDSPILFAAAKNDPVSFVQSLPTDKLNVIDEVQMVPEIFPVLKQKIDAHRRKGGSHALYLLTGSANLMALPTLAQALVGRMTVLSLFPLSASETHRSSKDVVGHLFGDPLMTTSCPSYNPVKVIQEATYPELFINPHIDRMRWMGDYLTTLLQRDIKMLSDIRHPEKVFALLSILALRAGSLVNHSSICTEIGLDRKTYDNYRAAILNTFLAFEIQAWAAPARINKRFTKSAKLFLTDCGMLCYLIRRDLVDVHQNDKTTFGHILENFVASELKKKLSALPGLALSHYRTADGKEVDFVLEQADGSVVGVEVKGAASVTKDDFKGLADLQQSTGRKFVKGVVLYCGREAVPFGDKLQALPLSYLWEG